MNFRIYQEESKLKNDEKNDRFPPRFIIEIMCKDHSCMLHAPCKISCYDKTKHPVFDDLFFNINIPAKRLPEAAGSIVTSKYLYILVAEIFLGGQRGMLPLLRSFCPLELGLYR